jgi:hypothetical protein
MAQVEATTRRVVAATPEAAYGTLADYENARHALLPEQFSEYEVIEGGLGAGTVVHWKLQATSKRVRDCLFDVTEPAAGTLVEKDRNSTMVNTWRVSPSGEGQAEVAVTTAWTGAGGVGGFFERTFAPKGLNRIHDALLAKLAAHLESSTA